MPNPDKWNEMYRKLHEYFTEKGHCDVVRDSNLNSKDLSIWVRNQRFIWKKRLKDQSDITKWKPHHRDCYQKLQEIKFMFKKNDYCTKLPWDKRYKELCIFKDNHNTCNVSSTYKENPTLYTWVRDQRDQYRKFRNNIKSVMTNEKINKLNSIGFEWKIRNRNITKTITNSSIRSHSAEHNNIINNNVTTGTHQNSQSQNISNNLPNHNNKNNILLLGMKYSVLNFFSTSDMWCHNIINKEKITFEIMLETFKSIIEYNKISPSSARDMIRILSLEYMYNCYCYTISILETENDSNRHSNINFNNRKFCKSLIQKYTQNISFKEVILDYFFMPNSWQKDHWKESFFRNTIPDLFKTGLLEEDGLIFIPFCLHCLEQIVINIEIISEIYCIEFVPIEDLKKSHKLWNATQIIPDSDFNNIFGKDKKQEEIYCVLTINQIKSSVQCKHIRNKLISVMEKINNVTKIRMIKLYPNKNSENKICGFVY